MWHECTLWISLGIKIYEIYDFWMMYSSDAMLLQVRNLNKIRYLLLTHIWSNGTVWLNCLMEPVSIQKYFRSMYANANYAGNWPMRFDALETGTLLQIYLLQVNNLLELSAYENIIVHSRNIKYLIHIILILTLLYRENWMQMTPRLEYCCS